MRRLAVGCTTDAHQLHGTFMAKMANCIFELDAGDMAALQKAKKSELASRGLKNLSNVDVARHITKDEVQLHCRRRTRGISSTTFLLEELLRNLEGQKGTDTLGVPLFNDERMWQIWNAQKRHIRCIQDVEGIQLYVTTGTLRKGGMTLNTYRCARGSTSLESFHLHLQRFVPGKYIGSNVIYYGGSKPPSF
jgi:hypothetical protein